MPYNTEEIRHTYKSKYNFECENKVILLIITDSKKCHYLAIKIFLHYIEEQHGDLQTDGDFYYINSFTSHSTQTN